MSLAKIARYFRFNEKLNKENAQLNAAEKSQNFFEYKINDLNKTIRVGLFKGSFEVVNDVESVSVSSKTADFI